MLHVNQYGNHSQYARNVLPTYEETAIKPAISRKRLQERSCYITELYSIYGSVEFVKKRHERYETL